MSRITLADANGLAPPAKSFNWYVSMLSPAGLNSSDNIKSVYVQDIQVPFESLDIKSRYRGGGHSFFPGDSNIDNFSITFYETDNFDVLQYLLPWKNSIFNAFGNFNSSIANTPSFNSNYAMPKQYMGKVVATFFNDAGFDTMSVTLFDVWPAKINDWQLNYMQSANIPLVCNFACNSAEVSITGRNLDIPVF